MKGIANTIMVLIAGSFVARRAFVSIKRGRKLKSKTSCHMHNDKCQHVVLQPPVIDDKTICSKIECVRPVRKDTLNISYDNVGGKHIFHNYGHGGSGWTLLFGCVDKSINMFLDAKGLHRDTYNCSVTVVGAGIIGLYTAWRLNKIGHKVSIVSRDFDNLTSHNAGGLLAPVSMDTSPKYQKDIDDVAITSFKKWDDIACNKDKIFCGCAKKMPVYSDVTAGIGLDVYINKGLIRNGEPVLIQFANSKPKAMIKYDTIYMEPIIMMQRLHDELSKDNISFYKQTVKDFSEIKSKVIFNCSGIGSLKLNNDKSLKKVYGHLLGLKDQPSGTRGYMIFTKIGEDYVYYMPKGEGLIGGTYVPENRYKGTPDEYFRKIKEAAQDFFK